MKWWGLIGGLAAIGGGIYVAVAALVVIGCLMAGVGLFIVATVLWVYYLRAVRRIVEDVDGSFVFHGPHVSIRASAGEVQSITAWWMGPLPLGVRTRNGNFFLPTDLVGFEDLLSRLLASNSIDAVRRYPL